MHHRREKGNRVGRQCKHTLPIPVEPKIGFALRNDFIIWVSKKWNAKILMFYRIITTVTIY